MPDPVCLISIISIIFPELHFLDFDDEDIPELYDGEYFPKNVVQNVLNNVKDKGHKSHHVFCQLDTLKSFNDNYEWRETAR